MKKELIDFLLVVKEIAVDVVTAFTEQSENAKKIADTFQRGIDYLLVLGPQRQVREYLSKCHYLQMKELMPTS